MRCPSESEVDDVLDRVAPLARAREVRRHVAECPRCLERHGAGFELELWGDALRTAIRVAPWWSRARRVAALAAAVVVGITGVARFAADTGTGASPPSAGGEASVSGVVEIAAPSAATVDRSPLYVAAMQVETGVRHPNGSESVTRRWIAGVPARVEIVESSVGLDGVVRRQERIVVATTVDRRVSSPSIEERGP
ncbi:MAG: zf-HC2 domain-containing protein [Planctomycetes bacterium]|nr:zf-HC2 domain-containing protein [Planctomycetota bacterium]